jgi:hypothetical protein
VQVHSLAVHAGDAGHVVDSHAARFVEPRQRRGFALRGGRGGRDRLAVGAAEADPSGFAPLDAVAAFVDEPVVVAAELDQVGEVGAAALCPVPDVVRVQEAVLAAAGEAAGSVAAP